MDWNQIETKWAVMARRIRADVKCGKTDETVIPRRRGRTDDAGRSIVVKEIVAGSAADVQKRDPVSTP